MEITNPEKETGPGQNTAFWQRVLPSSKKLLWFSLAYLVIFGIAEYIIYDVSNVAGLILHFAILLSLIISSVVFRDDAQRKLWMALGLVPLIRIISLVVPQTEIADIYWYFISAIPLFAGVYALMRTFKYSFADLGFNGKDLVLQALVAVTGLFMGALGYYILKPQALAEDNIQMALISAIILLLSTGLVEEMAFRGVMQKAAGVLGGYGWVYVAAAYALLHIGRGSAVYCLFVFGLSLFFGWIRGKSGSLMGVILAYGLYNIGLFLIFPYVF
jgi:uncharacterized protein